MEEGGDNLEEVGAVLPMGMEARKAGGEDMMVRGMDRTSDNQYQDRESCDKHLLITSGIMVTHKTKVEMEDPRTTIQDDKHLLIKSHIRSRGKRMAPPTAKHMPMDYRTDPSNPRVCTD
jgi:hypothetical protein